MGTLCQGFEPRRLRKRFGCPDGLRNRTETTDAYHNSKDFQKRLPNQTLADNVSRNLCEPAFGPLTSLTINKCGPKENNVPKLQIPLGKWQSEPSPEPPGGRRDKNKFNSVRGWECAWPKSVTLPFDIECNDNPGRTTTTGPLTNAPKSIVFMSRARNRRVVGAGDA